MAPLGNPATMAEARPVFRTELAIGMILGRSFRAARVFLLGRLSLGVATMPERLDGGLIETVLTGDLSYTIVNPPSRDAATLSACGMPVTAASPRLANRTNSSFVRLRCRKESKAFTHAAAVAPLLPRPNPGGTPLSIVISTPRPTNPASRSISIIGGPAALSDNDSGTPLVYSPSTRRIIPPFPAHRTVTVSL